MLERFLEILGTLAFVGVCMAGFIAIMNQAAYRQKRRKWVREIGGRE